MALRNLLIVDDEAINRKVLAGAFRSSLYNVLTAANGFEALRIMDEEQVDLVLLDIMMPGMDGFEVCRRILNTPRTHNVPIIFITALTDNESRLKGLKLGAVDFVTKPIDLVEVRLRVNHQLRLRELYMEQRRQNQHLQRDILEARKIQSSMLPPHELDLPGGMHYMREYFPCENLGGDFMDVMPFGDEYSLLYMADVSGHGVASALITIYVKERFHRLLPAMNAEDPAAVIAALNRDFLSMDLTGRYLTLFLAFLHHPTRTLHWSIAAGNNPPLVLHADGIEELSVPAPAVGWFEQSTWENRTSVLHPGDTLLMYSDAAIEIGPEDGEMLGRNGLQKLVEQIGLRQNPDLKILIGELLEYAGAIVFDDDLSLASVHVRED